MRKLIIAIAIIFIGNSLQALEIEDRKITVTASAEIFVMPDQIELEITLQEESGNNYLSKIEKGFWEKLGEQEINKKHLVLENVNVMYYWYYWWKTREATKKSKKIVLKLNKETNFIKLAKALNHDWVKDIKIVSVSNKNIDQHIKEVQLLSMKSAKEKATYLLESIDEEIGKVISVKELNIPKTANTTMHFQGNNKYSTESYRKAGGGSFESIPEIRLSYAVKSTFEIK